MKSILYRKFLDYRTKPYRELRKLVDAPECYVETVAGKSYSFEISAKLNGSHLLEVMILCERKPLFGGWFLRGAAKYFSVSSEGVITEDSTAW